MSQALDPLSTITTSLSRSQIIPDVLPPSFTPTLLFSITWPDGKEAMLGNELRREDVSEEPSVNFTPMNMPWEQADNTGEEGGFGDVTYTIVMVDPDAPSRKDPKFKSFRHWVLTGLKAPPQSTTESENLTAVHSRPATTPYRPPGPPPGTGIHRYTFLLFQEPMSSISIPLEAPEHGTTIEQRIRWDPIEFGEKYGLKLVAANFFLCRSEE
ncbi:hypothetical protein JAAARDRAFT_37416 [Jaapia argillacea MUCL 33604]|uniref:PEBP-like protein n=1 Tax=Jaapia argillacea MUCL 33604 TaxID=933084 RepID=A0A067PYI5_9AGAM|nr:hypothetical protein JAAARDRAFT_37416 [Jaapia argillacea MUCL 33604]